MNARIRRTLAAIEESVQSTDYRVSSDAYMAETMRLRSLLHLTPIEARPFNPSAMYEET